MNNKVLPMQNFAYKNHSRYLYVCLNVVYGCMCMFLFWLALLWYAHFVPENINFWSRMRFFSVPTSIWQFKVYLQYLDIFMQFHRKHRKKSQRQSLPTYTKAATSMLCRVKTDSHSVVCLSIRLWLKLQRPGFVRHIANCIQTR